MKKAALLLGIAFIAAAPAFAQSSQIGILFGGSKRFFSNSDKNIRTDLPADSWKLSNSVREIWYGFSLEPDTILKIKAGEITAPLGKVEAVPASNVEKGRIEHLDLILDYRFTEPFGSTGLFGGAGLYRQRSGPGSEGTDYGFQAGVNGDFPLSRRYGVIIEGAYHWVNYSYKPRFLTVTGGLRVRL